MVIYTPQSNRLARYVEACPQRPRKEEWKYIANVKLPSFKLIIDTLKRESAMHTALRVVKKFSPQTQQLHEALLSVARGLLPKEPNLAKFLEHAARAGLSFPPPGPPRETIKSSRTSSNGRSEGVRFRHGYGSRPLMLTAGGPSRRIADSCTGYDVSVALNRSDHC